MRLDRACHADRAKEKRDKSDEIQEPVKIVERFAEVLLSLRDRVVFESGFLDLRRELLHLEIDVRAGRELHEIEVTREAARFEQIRLREILERDVNARREARGGRGFTGHFRKRSGDVESDVTNLNRVAGVSAELQQQALIRHRRAAVAEALRRCRRCGFHFAVEGKISAERAHVDEPGAAAFREKCHRAEADFSRLGFA